MKHNKLTNTGRLVCIFFSLALLINCVSSASNIFGIGNLEMDGYVHAPSKLNMSGNIDMINYNVTANYFIGNGSLENLRVLRNAIFETDNFQIDGGGVFLNAGGDEITMTNTGGYSTTLSELLDNDTDQEDRISTIESAAGGIFTDISNLWTNASGQETAITGKVNKAGDTMTGTLFVTNISSLDNRFTFNNSHIGIGMGMPTAAFHLNATGIDGTPNMRGVQMGIDASGNPTIEITAKDGGYPLIDFQNDADGTDFDIRLILMGDDRLSFDGGYFTPYSDSGESLGTSAIRWKDLFVDYINVTTEMGIGGVSDPLGTLDILQNPYTGFGLVVGSDIDGQSRRDEHQKYVRIGMPHYDNDEKPIILLTGFATPTANDIRFGGGTSVGDAATSLTFYTAANSKTNTGTIRGYINSDGQLTGWTEVYADTVGGTNRDLYIDDTGNIGYVSSSVENKENITNMSEDSSRIFDLRPVTFDYKDKSMGTHQYGLVAEEVEEVMPELVSYKQILDHVDEDGKPYYNHTNIPETVSYSKLIPLMLNELQKQQKEIQNLTQELNDLKERVTTLEQGSTKP